MLDDDQALIGRFVATGDEDAFRELFRRHTPALLQFVRRFLGARSSAAEDVVQEVWLRAAARLDQFAWRSALRTWLMSVAIRCAHEELRRERRQPGEPLSELGVPAPQAGDPGQAIDLERAIRQLPDGYRKVFVLHDLIGWTHETIGRLLEIQPSTSKSQLSRARQALRDQWSDRTREERPHG